MSESLQKARAERDRAAQLRRRRVECEEELRHTAYRVDALESQVGAVDQDIDQLNHSVCGLLLGLFTDKQQRIDALRARRAELQDKLDTCEHDLDRAEQNLVRIDHELAELGDVEARYNAALSAKLETLPSTTTQDLDQELEALRGAQRAANKTIEAGEAVVSHFGTARRSALSINKRMRRGLVTGAVLNTVMARAKRPASDGVVRVLERFVECLQDAGPMLMACTVEDRPTLEKALEEYQRQAPGWSGLAMDDAMAGDMESVTVVMVQRLQDVDRELQRRVQQLEAERLERVEQA